ncbi:MAG: iron-containing alcohol dehydrogenase [Chloroflexota bacterium]|nr:iron-containing alcohol dehydrogenase [Chloroflexota bacterium]
MQRPPRGAWNGFDQMKPASEYDIRYGHHLVRSTSSQWPSYVAIASPTAYRMTEPHLTRRPETVGYPARMDFGYLKQFTEGLPNDIGLVVGIGGGLVLDVSKYVALTRQLPLVLIPTIVSTGAIIHSVFAEWEGRNLGDTKNWPWIDPEYVLVDYDIVLSAPDHLNIAGVGDVLCGYSCICEWKHREALGIGEAYDESVTADMNALHARIVENFPKTLSADGTLTPASVKLIMNGIKDRDSNSVTHPDAPAGDHAFIVAAELANDRSWVHGELASLGTVIIAWHTEQSPETIIDRLDTCGVRWRPSDMGMSKDELAKALAECPGYMGDASRGRDLQSVLRLEPVVGERFERLWGFLEDDE